MADQRVNILLALKTKIEGFESAMGSLGALQSKLLALTVASGPALLVKANGELASSIKSLASAAQVSTRAFQTLSYGMKEDSVSAETLSASLVTLKRNLQDAKANSNSPLNGALRALRLDAAGLQALSPEQQLQILGQRLNSATDRNVAFNAALDLLGAKHAPKVLESLKRLANEGLAAWDEKSKSLRLSDEQLDTLDRAGNQLANIYDKLKLIAAHGQLKLTEFFSAPLPAWAAGLDSGRIKADTEAHARRKLRASGALPVWTAEDPMHGRGLMPGSAGGGSSPAGSQAAMEKTMSDAALAAQLGELDGSGRRGAQRDLGRMQGINSNITSAFLRKSAASEGALLKAALGTELAAAIDASNDALRRFGAEVERIDNSPFLTDVEKHRMRIDQLKQENVAIDAQIELLKKFAAEHPDVDPSATRGQIRGLQDRAVRNGGAIGRPDLAAGGVGMNLAANVTDQLNGLRTPAQNVADTISGTIGGAFASIQDNVSGLIMGTQSWGHALANVANTITGSLVNGIVKMFTEWIQQRALSALASMAWSTKEGAVDAAAKAPGAALTSISSWGVAAAVGVAAIVAAMAAFGGFESGGYTGSGDSSRIAGVVHQKEWVANAATTQNPETAPLIAALDAHQQGGRSLGGMSFSGVGGGASASVGASAAMQSAGSAAVMGAGAGKPQRIVVVVANNRSHGEELLNDPAFTNRLLSMTRRDLGVS